MIDTDWQSTASEEMLLKRALMLKSIRAFFDARDIVEVETPVLSRYRTTDPHLDSLQTHCRDRSGFLNTSPEYAMKRLLASLGKPIYQICKAFRDDEPGPLHNPEFSILEWYRPGFSQQQLMAELEQLLQALHYLSSADEDTGEQSDPFQFTRLSYQQAFEAALGLNPHVADSAMCYEVVMANDIEIPQGLIVEDSVDDWLDWLLVQSVAPAFDRDGFTFLYDYPASQGALAKIENDAGQQQVARRFELFFGDIELANGFDELTDAQEQQQRFQHENSLRESMGKSVSEMDRNLIAALEYGLPQCSGVAVGLDRLLMILTRAKSIDNVIAFPWAKA